LEINLIFSRLNNKLFVKLADNALSRDIFSDDYHCLGDNENRPIMWLAYETLRENVYTVQTDIVS
jgi:RYK receptor-like tyrosine kinase